MLNYRILHQSKTHRIYSRALTRIMSKRTSDKMERKKEREKEKGRESECVCVCERERERERERGV